MFGNWRLNKYLNLMTSLFIKIKNLFVKARKRKVGNSHLAFNYMVWFKKNSAEEWHDCHSKNALL